MMGRQTVDQSQLFYLFNLEKRIPERHLLRRINPTVTRILIEFREKLEPFYSEIGRPSIDPELMIRMLIVGYCYGIRFERKLSRRSSCTSPIAGSAASILTTGFPTTRLSPSIGTAASATAASWRQPIQAVVRACMGAGPVKGKPQSTRAILEADASRYHGRLLTRSPVATGASDARDRRIPRALDDEHRNRRPQAAEGALAGGRRARPDREANECVLFAPG